MTLPKIKCAAQRLNRSEPFFSELFIMVLRFGHSRRHVIVSVSIVSYRSVLVREVVAKTTCLGSLGSGKRPCREGQEKCLGHALCATIPTKRLYLSSVND